MGIVTDRSAIQFRMLNRSKGPAMWSLRAQSDRMVFSKIWRETLENTPNLYMWQDNVNRLLIEDGAVCGVVTDMGVEFKAKAVILTAGTFLNGLMHIGPVKLAGGRVAEPASRGLTEQLRALGFATDRMKTGTLCVLTDVRWILQRQFRRRVIRIFISSVIYPRFTAN